MNEIQTAVLQAVRELGQPYGLEIWHATEAALPGRIITLSAIYIALEALEERGLVRSWEGGATPERGGRRKRHYAAQP